MESASNPGEGDYIVGLPSGTEYLFNVSQQGYLFYSDNFDFNEVYSAVEPMKKDIPLEPIRAGKLITLNNIFFATDSYKLEEKSKVELEKVYQFLALNRNLKVEISGHTDNTGATGYNMQLSEQRAMEVSRYLTELGIAEVRLESKGYGDTKPVADNSSEEGKAQNRRTELKILSVGGE